MRRGSYRGRRVDFSKFAAAVFIPHLYFGSAKSSVGCGASALSLLSGASPETIAGTKHGPHYSDDFMLRFLRRQGFRTLQLTLCNVSGTWRSIGAHHVLLISQLFRANEGTWGVIFNGQYYHNFEIYSVESLSFLNKPILSAYLVIHPRWQLVQLPLTSPIPKPLPKRRRLTLPRLGVMDRAPLDHSSEDK